MLLAQRSLWTLLVACVLLAGTVGIASEGQDRQGEVEQLLMDFQNQYLQNVDYSAKIRYPKSPEYVKAWGKLVIAFGKDTAFVLTAGESEAPLKLIENVGNAGSLALETAKLAIDADQGKLAEGIGKLVGDKIVDLGVHQAEKYVGTKIPGIRTGIQVYKVLAAGADEKERVSSTIEKQKETMEFIGQVAPAFAAIDKSISSVESEDKRAEYRQMLMSMLQRKAELTVYRQMARDSLWNEAVAGGGGSLDATTHALDTRINEAIPGEKDRHPTPDVLVAQTAERYIAGALSQEQFEAFLRDRITDRIGALPRVTVNEVLAKLKPDLESAKAWHDAVNRYGGGSATQYQKKTAYSELLKAIPQEYRQSATVAVGKVHIPINDSVGAVHTGPSAVPFQATAQIPENPRNASTAPKTKSQYAPADAERGLREQLIEALAARAAAESWSQKAKDLAAAGKTAEAETARIQAEQLWQLAGDRSREALLGAPQGDTGQGMAELLSSVGAVAAEAIPQLGRFREEYRAATAAAERRPAASSLASSKPASAYAPSNEPKIEAQYRPAKREDVDRTMKLFKSIPGGISLEGEAEGGGTLRSAKFDPASNSLILDGERFYRLPISAAEAASVFLTVHQDERFGISMSSKPILYSCLPEDDPVIVNLLLADHFLGHLCYAYTHSDWLAGYIQPEGYKPKPQEGGSAYSAVTFTFGSYRFYTKKGELTPHGPSTFTTVMVPLRRGAKGADGGHLPDYSALGEKMSPEHEENVQNLTKSFNFYARERFLQSTIRYGEVAALARAMKKGGVDLRELAIRLSPSKASLKIPDRLAERGLPVCLLTGFEPLGGLKVNSSWETIRKFDGQTIAGFRIVTALLPVVYDEIAAPLAAAIEDNRPAVVIALGAGSKTVLIETIARNGYAATRPKDNKGREPPRDEIISGGLKELPTLLPAGDILASLAAARIGAGVSDDAGGYLCNECFYRLMQYQGPAGSSIRFRGFVHVPHFEATDPLGGAYTPGKLETALRIVLETLANKPAVEPSK